MQRRASPWRWPAAVGLAVGLLGLVVFAVPRAWIDRFFSPLDLDRLAAQEPPRPWLVLLPPPEVAPAPERPASPPTARPAEPPAPPADWWTRGWRVRAADQTARVAAPTPEDSARVVLEAVGLPTSLVMLARPDSVLAARLLLMRREDALSFGELAPYFQAMARARAYRDLQSRAADMFDDFLHQEIIVPD